MQQKKLIKFIESKNIHLLRSKQFVLFSFYISSAVNFHYIERKKVLNRARTIVDNTKKKRQLFNSSFYYNSVTYTMRRNQSASVCSYIVDIAYWIELWIFFQIVNSTRFFQNKFLTFFTRCRSHLRAITMNISSECRTASWHLWNWNSPTTSYLTVMVEYLWLSLNWKCNDLKIDSRSWSLQLLLIGGYKISNK